ncbi:hypothetical protein [Shouchella miscanthi]|uniref:hypothetical protein n=1 Tax=Shouchella miscanthi TaxID=2598861 RepID=UPI00119D8B68|nr:hypothetical protein [Shouchella miscanthi]
MKMLVEEIDKKDQTLIKLNDDSKRIQREILNKKNVLQEQETEQVKWVLASKEKGIIKKLMNRYKR